MIRTNFLTISLYLPLILPLFLGACSFRVEKTPTGIEPNAQGAVAVDSNYKYIYAEVNERVLAPKCLSCHGEKSSTPLTTYAEVASLIGQIKQRVLIDRDMPPTSRQALSTEELEMVQQWIVDGAPEFRSLTKPSEIPTPSATPSPLVAAPSSPQVTVPIEKVTYSFIDLQSKVLSTKCLMCHDQTSDTPLETYEQVKAKISEISNQVFEQGTMPPEGSEALTPDELAILKTWTSEGGPEHSDTTPSATPSAIESNSSISPSPSPSLDSPTPSPSPKESHGSAECKSFTHRPGFEEMTKKIITPLCLDCHSKFHSKENSKNLIKYENVVSYKEKIIERTFNPSTEKPMPPKTHPVQPSSGDLELFKTWISLGMPKDAEEHCDEWTIPQPSPSPSVKPSPAFKYIPFNKVYREVIKKECNLCHGIKFLKILPVENLSFTTYDDIKKHAADIWREVDNCAMPKFPFANPNKLNCKNNKFQLKPEKKKLLKNWLIQEEMLK